MGIQKNMESAQTTHTHTHHKHTCVHTHTHADQQTELGREKGGGSKQKR